jgi:hypothetical protein
LGLQYRFRENFETRGENELRLTQQYDIRHQDGALRLGHRLRAEQRFRLSATGYRFRYRLALDSPLQGQKLNTGEVYFIGSLEALLGFARASSPEYDQRVEVSIGWLLQQGLKAETGLEYRLEDYTGSTENRLLITSNLIISL